MLPQLSELETVLTQMVAEHRRLLAQVERHAEAMRRIDLPVMDDSGRQQEACRLRINSMEQRRRYIVQQIARAAKAAPLMKLRAELKEVAEQIAARTRISGKVAAAVLGHLNTAVRLVAGAVERAGLYTRRGIPRASSRVGMIETVG
jgi:hypothetical protein